MTPPAIVLHAVSHCSIVSSLQCCIGAAQRGLLAAAGGQVEASVGRTVTAASQTLHPCVFCHTVLISSTLLPLELLQAEPVSVLCGALQSPTLETCAGGQGQVDTLHQEPIQSHH